MDGRSCIDGVCVSGDPVTSCTTDADCGADAVCISDACVSTDVGTSEISAQNPGIAFGAIVVNETNALVAPDAPAPPDPIATEGDASPTDGATGKPAPEECACLWSVLPFDAATLAPADACAAALTSTSAGEMTITVDVTCPDRSATFTQRAVATVPPTPCETNDDCADTEQCTGSICQPRTGPVVTLLADRSRSPYLAVFDLRIEDRSGLPIVDGITRDNFRVFENDISVDFEETGYYLTPAPSLPMRVVIVLDYTVSMSNAGAIGSMVSAATDFVGAAHFTATHDIGVVEFHDRTGLDAGYSVVVPLTEADSAGKTAIADAIPLEGELEPGLSRAWDSIGLAISLLAETEPQPGERRAVVFLTDGQDTTSEVTSDEVLASAVAAGAAFYPIGFGDDAATETLLRSLAEATGGRYFAADAADELAAVFAGINDDLRGQWTFSYVTQHNAGTLEVRTEFTWGGATTSFDTELNVASLAGDIHATVIEVLDRSYDVGSGRTSFLLNAAYVPRNINRWRLFVAQSGATFTMQQDGGLIAARAGWSVIPDGGTFDLVGATSIEFGSFGYLGTVSVPGNAEQLQITHDDSIYDSLAQQKSVTFEGDARRAPPTLTVGVSPAAGGVVVADPSRFAYAVGESVTISAGALGDHVFEKWSGGATGTASTTTVTLDTDLAVTAVFYPPRTITVTISPADGGTVAFVPNRTTYRHGEIVQLTATSAAGKSFSAWSGGATGTATTVTITMDADKAVTATFTTP